MRIQLQLDKTLNNFEKTGNRLVFTLVASRSLYAAAFTLMGTISSIAAVELAGGNNQWTGVPDTLILVSAALVAYPVGRLTDRAGHRIAMSVGYILGIAGAVIAGWAMLQQSLTFLLAGIFLTGAARGTIAMGRYAAAEASPPDRRGRAISLFVFGGTVGSIVGTSLIGMTNKAANAFSFPDLSAPWFGAAILLALGLLLIVAFLRPDPREISRQFLVPEPASHYLGKSGRTAREVLRDARAKIAIGAMVFGQLAMITVMTVTAVHMHSAHHGLSSISLVILVHTLGMFGLSYLTGWLVDKAGRTRIIAMGSIILVVASLIAALSVGVLWLAAALFLLGLGWNFSFVAGSALLDDILRPHEKGRVQGTAEMMVNVASGLGSLGSGLVFSAAGFAVTSSATIVLAAVPLVLILVLRIGDQRFPWPEAAAGTAS